MLRNLLSVIVAVLIGWIIFSLIQTVNYLIVPTPEGFEASTPGSMREFIISMPFYGWLVVISGYFIGSVVAGYITGRFAESKTKIFPGIVSILFMIGWLNNIMFLPHPLSVILVVFLIFPAATLAGHKFAVAQRS